MGHEKWQMFPYNIYARYRLKDTGKQGLTF